MCSGVAVNAEMDELHRRQELIMAANSSYRNAVGNNIYDKADNYCIPYQAIGRSTGEKSTTATTNYKKNT